MNHSAESTTFAAEKGNKISEYKNKKKEHKKAKKVIDEEDQLVLSTIASDKVVQEKIK